MQKVEVYFNLHKKCLSIVAKEGDKKGLVIDYAQSISLIDAIFKVSEAGRQRVLKENRKNVHAKICGTVTDSDLGKLNTTVTYNPYKYSSFVNKADLSPVYKADKVRIVDRLIAIE